MSANDEPATTDNGAWANLPLVEQVERWEQILPGSAERMLRQVEEDFAHHRKLQWTQIGVQAIGALLGSGAAVGYIWLAKYFLDHGEATAGAGILGSGAVAIAGLFVGRRIGQDK